jgi:hypothetical protein
MIAYLMALTHELCHPLLNGLKNTVVVFNDLSLLFKHHTLQVPLSL